MQNIRGSDLPEALVNLPRHDIGRRRGYLRHGKTL
jgi:hypothetical protein